MTDDNPEETAAVLRAAERGRGRKLNEHEEAEIVHLLNAHRIEAACLRWAAAGALAIGGVRDGRIVFLSPKHAAGVNKP